MMIKLFWFKGALLFFLIFFLLPAGVVSAKTMQDNFDDSVLDEWDVVPDPDRTLCSAPWHINSGRVGIAINQPSCTTNLVPSDALWDELGDEYTIELDMYFIGGADHNFAFRFTPSTPSNDWYDFHFISPSQIVLERVPAGSSSNSVSYPVPNKPDPYRIKAVVESGNIELFIDDVLVMDYEYDPQDDRFPTGKFALRAGTGAVTVSETYFDNIVVTSIDDTLGVPHFMQTDPEWAENIYDNATAWNTYGVDDFVGTWGCALTSAAMVLNHHGVDTFHGVNDAGNNFPDGSELNPGTLNNWLNLNASSAWRNGATDWPLIASLTKRINDGNSGSQKLEWSRIESSDFSATDSWADQGNPDILDLQEPLSPSGQHFAVVNGVVESGVEYFVRDPFFDRDSLMTSDVGLNKIERFVPTSSNFSYLIAHSDVGLDVMLESGGLRTGIEGGSEYEELPDSWFMYVKPLNGYFDSSAVVAGEGFNEIGVPKPLDGSYQLTLSTNESGFYDVEVYGYDLDGEKTAFSENVFVSEGLPVVLGLGYSQDPEAEPPDLVRQMTFEQMRADIGFARDQGWIKRRWLEKGYLILVRLAERFYPTHERLSLRFLDRLETLFERNQGRWLTQEGYEFLSGELELLVDSL